MSAYSPSRRDLLAGAVGIATSPLFAAAIRAQERGLDRAANTPPHSGDSLSMAIGPQPLGLEAGEPGIQPLGLPLHGVAWRGKPLEVTIKNALQGPVMLDSAALNRRMADPLAGFTRIAAGDTLETRTTFKAAGSCWMDIGLTGGDQPLQSGAFRVLDAADTPADQDELFLIEDWRQSADGALLAPGRRGAIAKTSFTVNRKPTLDFAVRTHQRLRLRLLNGCHRQPVALKFEDHIATVVAIDGQPSEPFPGRDGQLILAPGSRIDVMIDALKPPGTKSAILLHDGRSPRPIAHLVYQADPMRAQPLGPIAAAAANDLPERLDLKSAFRSDLALGAASADWGELAAFQAKPPPPAFTVKPGRVVVLALANSGPGAATFRLHGHHFRLLDRLDDGWKPFWLDRLLLNPGETHRIAFQPQQAGGFLLEAMGVDWSAPKRLRWYGVG